MGNDVPSSRGNPCPDPSSDRRSLRRETVSALAAVLRDAQEDAAHVDNLTVNGAFLRGCTGDPLVVGATLTMHVAVPTLDRIIVMRAVVRWVADGDDSSGGVVFEPPLDYRDALAIVRAHIGG